jgi:hypothetical protein
MKGYAHLDPRSRVLRPLRIGSRGVIATYKGASPFTAFAIVLAIVLLCVGVYAIRVWYETDFNWQWLNIGSAVVVFAFTGIAISGLVIGVREVFKVYALASSRRTSKVSRGHRTWRTIGSPSAVQLNSNRYATERATIYEVNLVVADLTRPRRSITLMRSRDAGAAGRLALDIAHALDVELQATHRSLL